MEITTQICSKCGKKYFFTEEFFYKDKDSSGGLLKICKECVKKQTKEYSKTHKKQRKEQAKKYYKNNKEQIKRKTKEYRETHKEQRKEYNKEILQK